MIDVCSEILSFNQNREKERLMMKYRNMRVNPFIFLRATCHLFYTRLPQSELFTSAPFSWCVGDLHLENFGSYKGDNRLVYFDLNDFDEAVLAPLTWDLVRFIASILVGAKNIGLTGSAAKELAISFLDSYKTILKSGKSHWIERETSNGLIRNLLSSLRQRQRGDFLDHRTIFKGDERRIRLDGKKALPVSPRQRKKVEVFFEKFSIKQINPDFFQPIDIARRVAGNGSLGIERYIILVNGKGGPNGNYLLDLKQATPSSLIPYLHVTQPNWQSEAHRIVNLQRRMQAVSMAFLQPIEIGKRSYILRGLQPTEDRVVLDHSISSFSELNKVIQTMGNILASAQLRSSGRDGSAIADELIAFARRSNWEKELLDCGQECARQVAKDWKIYSVAYDDGFFM